MLSPKQSKPEVLVCFLIILAPKQAKPEVFEKIYSKTQNIIYI